ncbi:MAG: hypothetical protein CL933_09015 [Deltaproteobacteria bacterium]|nr:hypothetical protein [Deltaproteobacteria bacterium]
MREEFAFEKGADWSTSPESFCWQPEGTYVEAATITTRDEVEYEINDLDDEFLLDEFLVTADEIA